MRSIPKARNRAIMLVAVAGSTLATNHARAIVVSWVNGTGGSASTLANWSPQVLPAAGDTMQFDIPSAYVVTWDAAAPLSVTDMTVGTSNAAFSFITPLTVTGSCLIQTVSSTAGGAMTVSSGVFNVHDLTIGVAPHATHVGTLSVSGSTSQLVVNNYCNIGGTNDGMLRVLNRGSMVSFAPVRVGVGQPGTLVITDATTAARPSLQMFGGGNQLRVGDGAHGSVSVSNGSLVTISGDVYAGPLNGVQGSVTVGGSSAGFEATLNIAGQLLIANNNGPGAGGVGTFRVESGGDVTVGALTTLGDGASSNGFLDIQGGRFLTHGLVQNTGGSFVHTNGTIIVDGSIFAPRTSGSIYNIGGTGSGGGVLTLQNGAQWTLPVPGSVASPVFLTSSGAGSTLNVLSGSDCFLTGPELRIGIPNQRGTLHLADASTLTTSGTLNMGGLGSTLSISGGSTMGCAAINFSGGDSDTTACTISGTGTSLHCSGPVRLGHNQPGHGGICQLTISDGGEFNSTFVDASAASVRFRRVHGAGGSLVLHQGTITASDEIEYSNTATPLQMTSGVINAPLLTLNGASLTGSGTINADIANTGTITPSGAGLIITGQLDDNGLGVSGSRITFGAGGSYTGNGLLDCEVHVLQGGAITPGGDVTLGKSTSTDGFSCLGALNIGSTNVVLRDDDGAVLSGVTTLAGGTLECAGGLRFVGGTQAVFRGFGTITSGDAIMDGRIEPGLAEADQTGFINFVALSFGVTGQLVIDIEGDGDGQVDLINVDGELDLRNASLIVNVLGNYEPAPGASFRIARAGTLAGSSFGAVHAPGFRVEYGARAVELVYEGLCDSIDFNHDGLFPDSLDIDDYLSVFGGGPCSNDPGCGDIDFNNDGLFPDAMDIDALLSVFSGGECVV